MLPINGLHIEPTNICTLKCPGCARTRFINQWPQHWKNHNLDIDDLLNFLDIDISNIKIDFCGNYGDPIYHPKFIQMVERIKSRGARVDITTNASYKTKDWWTELCGVLSEVDTVRFSIDGIPENFVEYRINADWDSIKVAIETCVANKIATVWKFIPFKFNQQDIDQAKKIASDLGINRFLLDPSDRYDSQTQYLVPDDTLIGPRKFARDNNRTVDPKCQLGREHFVTATGHYSPCCYVADHRFYYKTMFGKNQKLFDIKTSRLSELLRQPSVIEFFDKIPDSPPTVCKFNCPKI